MLIKKLWFTMRIFLLGFSLKYSWKIANKKVNWEKGLTTIDKWLKR